MNRQNQIIAGIVSALFAGACIVVLLLVPDVPQKWALAGFGIFGITAVYNFAPVTMGDFFGEARETADAVRDRD